MPTHFPCVYSHSVLNPVMLWKKAYFSLATCIQYILHTTLDTVSVVWYMCATICDFYCCCQGFPCLHLLVVAAFHRISASVLQIPTVDGRDDIFLPWLVVGAGALQNCFKAVRLAKQSLLLLGYIKDTVCLFEQVTPIKSDDLAGCLPAVLPWLCRACLVGTLIPDDLSARSQIE